MKPSPALILAATLCAILPSCVAPQNPVTTASATDNGMAPLSIAGSKLHYTDNHSRNTYTFRPDGTFQFDYVHHSGTDTGGRGGRYRYAITTPSHATIDCGEGEVLTVAFESPLSGTFTVEGDVRPYRFTVTRPDGE